MKHKIGRLITRVSVVALTFALMLSGLIGLENHNHEEECIYASDYCPNNRTGYKQTYKCAGCGTTKVITTTSNAEQNISCPVGFVNGATQLVCPPSMNRTSCNPIYGSHSFTVLVNNNNGTHSYKCRYGCGTVGSTSACSYGAWASSGASTHSHSCTVCGYSESQAHSMSHWYNIGSQHRKNCSTCGYSETYNCNSNSAYISGGYHWTQCSVCGGNDRQGAPCEYYIQLHYGAYNSVTQNIKVTYGQPITMPTSAWSGYQFTGYYTGGASNGTKFFDNGGSLAINDGTFFQNGVWKYFTTSGDGTVVLHLYAGWNYTVSYSGNGATYGYVAPQTFTWQNANYLQGNAYYSYGAYYNSPTTTVTRYIANGAGSGTGFYRVGYDFLGWSTTPTATSATWGPGQLATDPTAGSNTLYAIWAPHVYTITYRNSDGSVITNTNGNNTTGVRYVTYNNKVDLSLIPSVNTKGSSYSFIGWGISPSSIKILNSMNAGSTVYEASIKKSGTAYNNATSPLYPPGNISLYAVYSTNVSDVDNTGKTVRAYGAPYTSYFTAALWQGIYNETITNYIDLSRYGSMTKIAMFTYTYAIWGGTADSIYGTTPIDRNIAVSAYDYAGNGRVWGIGPSSNTFTPIAPVPETHNITINYYLEDKQHSGWTQEDVETVSVINGNSFALNGYAKSYSGYNLEHIDYDGTNIGNAFNHSITVTGNHTYNVYYTVTTSTLTVYANGYTSKNEPTIDARFVITDDMTQNADGSYYDAYTGFTISADKTYATKVYYTGETIMSLPAAELRGYGSIYCTMTVNGKYTSNDLWALAKTGNYSARTGTYIQTPTSITDEWYEYELNYDGSYKLDGNGNKIRVWNVFATQVYDNGATVYVKDSMNNYTATPSPSTDALDALHTVKVTSTSNTAMPNGDLNIYMQWQAKNYNVCFDAGTNGGFIVGSEYDGEEATFYEVKYGSTLSFYNKNDAMSFIYNSNEEGESGVEVAIGAAKFQDGYENDNSMFIGLDGKFRYKHRWAFIGWSLSPDPSVHERVLSVSVTKDNMTSVTYVDEEGNAITLEKEQVTLYAIYSRDIYLEYTYYDSEAVTNKSIFDIATVYNTETSTDVTLKDIPERVITYTNTETNETIKTGDTKEDGTVFSPWTTQGWALNDTTATAGPIGSAKDTFTVDATLDSNYHHFYATYYINLTVNFETQTNDYVAPYTGTAYYNASGTSQDFSCTLPGKLEESYMSHVSWIRTFPWTNCSLCGNNCHELATEDTTVNGCVCDCYYPTPINTLGCICCYEYTESVVDINCDTTFTARWDYFPELEARDKYFTVEELGSITESTLLEDIISTDHEDVTTDIHVKDLEEVLEDLKSFTTDGELDILYTTTDSYGNTTQARITIHITDTSTKMPEISSYVRFLTNAFYKDDVTDTYIEPENGGLEEDSLWIQDSAMSEELERALDNADAASNGEEYYYTYSFSMTYDEMQEAKEYLKDNGYGKYEVQEDVNPLDGFIGSFLEDSF